MNRRSTLDNGMLKLVLHDLTERVIKDMTSSRNTKSTDMQTEDMRRSINGFYDTLEEHPAILSDRVVFSSKKSDFEPENLKSGVFDEDQSDVIDSSEEFNMNKRDPPFHTVCRSKVPEVREIASGINMRGEEVKLKQPGQKFYITECERGGLRSVSCSGIDSTFSSRCMEKKSWTKALVWSKTKQKYVWDAIKISTCCVCGIDTRYINGQ
ncbi:neurotrophin-3-like [Ptychodera flava]|uniref:neurotrophin-3-like n=1 Tax=Ptychodera flava TaxID=63121 RepID=UPI00396A1019